MTTSGSRSIHRASLPVSRPCCGELALLASSAARVLVVDDESGIRSAVAKCLAHEGHEVVEAGDGASALQLLRDETFDIVITDLYMPSMDGMELIIRLEQMLSRPVVIAISGGGFVNADELLHTAERLGA